MKEKTTAGGHPARQTEVGKETAGARVTVRSQIGLLRDGPEIEPMPDGRKGVAKLEAGVAIERRGQCRGGSRGNQIVNDLSGAVDEARVGCVHCCLHG
jgi:hypothetical protein